MQQIIEKILIYLLCFVLLVTHFDTTTCVVASLTAIIASTFSYYVDKGSLAMLLICFTSALTIPIPGITMFLPVISYDSADRKLSYKQKSVSYLAIVLAVANICKEVSHVSFVWLCILTILAGYIGRKTQYMEDLQETIQKNRDADRELQLLLEQKNVDLIEKSHYEIEMATLHERNRIAREIHDNVGHLLTRSILQVGALNTINKNPDIAPHYQQLSTTLNQAMDTIRASVHNLYHSGIDLKSSIEGFMETIESPQIYLHYDVNQISQTITYHFLSIIKEAVNNTIRHSNADTVHISLMEHPRFYQLTIEDNGTIAKADFNLTNNTSYGMGLSSIQERISSLQGTMKIFTTNGFKIFITVMKKER